MYRHRRHVSLDSYGSTSIRGPPAFSNFTLQSGPHAPSGLRTARLTAHTSPLALATAISSPLSPKLESTDEMDSMEEEMERMVSSVVTTPVDQSLLAEPSPRLSEQSKLGLGLPGTLQEQQMRARSALSTPPTRSLLGSNGHEHEQKPTVSLPKLNMGMPAAFGNYRKRCLSAVQIVQPPTPEVRVSDASPPTRTTLHGPLTAAETASPSSLLSPPTLQNGGPLSVPSDRPLLHRRSASAGTLPSLDQIREWSLRRHGVTGDNLHEEQQQQYATVPGDHHANQKTPTSANSMSAMLSPPVIHIQGASPPRLSNGSPRGGNRLQQVLKERRMDYRLPRPVSLPSSPVDENVAMFHASSPTQDRSHCARQMVHVLEKRKSLTLVS